MKDFSMQGVITVDIGRIRTHKGKTDQLPISGLEDASAGVGTFGYWGHDLVPTYWFITVTMSGYMLILQLNDQDFIGAQIGRIKRLFFFLYEISHCLDLYSLSSCDHYVHVMNTTPQWDIILALRVIYLIHDPEVDLVAPGPYMIVEQLALHALLWYARYGHCIVCLWASKSLFTHLFIQNNLFQDKIRSTCSPTPVLFIGSRLAPVLSPIPEVETSFNPGLSISLPTGSRAGISNTDELLNFPTSGVWPSISAPIKGVPASCAVCCFNSCSRKAATSTM
jgi:hypothetical protein